MFFLFLPGISKPRLGSQEQDGRVGSKPRVEAAGEATQMRQGDPSFGWEGSPK